MRRFQLAFALLAFGSGVGATSLKDFWSTRSPDDPHFHSQKSSLALEECIALEVSEKVGVPNIIHGDRETLITGLTPGLVVQPIGGARIVDNGSAREIFVGAVHSGGWRDKVSMIVQGCI